MKALVVQKLDAFNKKKKLEDGLLRVVLRSLNLGPQLGCSCLCFPPEIVAQIPDEHSFIVYIKPPHSNEPLPLAFDLCRCDAVKRSQKVKLIKFLLFN